MNLFNWISVHLHTIHLYIHLFIYLFIFICLFNLASRWEEEDRQAAREEKEEKEQREREKEIKSEIIQTEQDAASSHYNLLERNMVRAYVQCSTVSLPLIYLYMCTTYLYITSFIYLIIYQLIKSSIYFLHRVRDMNLRYSI